MNDNSNKFSSTKAIAVSALAAIALIIEAETGAPVWAAIHALCIAFIFLVWFVVRAESGIAPPRFLLSITRRIWLLLSQFMDPRRSRFLTRILGK